MADRQKVLAVDDSLMICQKIEKVLKDEDITLFQTHSAGETLDLLETMKPDLILLDVILPDMEGYELIHLIQEKVENQIPVIFLTSKDGDDDVTRGFSLGASDYIKKPFRPEELRSRVKAHLKKKRQTDELRILNETLRANMERLSSVVYRDELTGLYNRYFLVEQLAQDLAEEGRQDALVMIDVDDFKNVNDSYGHVTGDLVLKCIANIMETVCRRHKVVRWGGEEFLVVLMAVTEAETQTICEKIRAQVSKFPFLHESITFYCTVTLGVTIYDKKIDLKENVKHADNALYAGKTSGKNKVVWYKTDK